MKNTTAKLILIIILAAIPLKGYSSGVPVPVPAAAPNTVTQTNAQKQLIPKSINITPTQQNKPALQTTPKPVQKPVIQPAKNTQKQTQKPAIKPVKSTQAQSQKPVQHTKSVKPAEKETKQPIIQPTKQTQQQPQKQTEDFTPSRLNDIREQAKFLYNSNKLDEAQQLFNKIPESERNSQDFLFIANIAQDNGKPIDAIFFLKKAIELDDQNYKAHYNLGNLYFADDKINMAIDEYKKVLKIKKDFAYAYYNKGCCYLKKKNWFNAKYEFGLAIKANPEEPSFYYNLAYTYKMMKRHKKAQEALDMYNELMSR